VAIAALVCALIGLLPLGVTGAFAPVGLGLGLLALRQQRRRPERFGGRRRAAAAVLAGMAGLLLWPAGVLHVLPALRGWAARVQHKQDFANLRAISRGLAAYARQFGTYPPRLEALLDSASISPHHLASPWSDQRFARCDYNYIAGLAPGDPAHWLLVFGDPAVYGHAGAPLLLVDGTVRFAAPAELDALQRTTMQERAAARTLPAELEPAGPLEFDFRNRRFDPDTRPATAAPPSRQGAVGG
jgi:hypothetical protein